jgi:hypothetical protein
MIFSKTFLKINTQTIVKGCMKNHINEYSPRGISFVTIPFKNLLKGYAVTLGETGAAADFIISVSVKLIPPHPSSPDRQETLTAEEPGRRWGPE